MMDQLAVKNSELCVEKSKPNIIIDKKICKLVDSKNKLEQSEVQKLIETIQTNSISSLDLSYCQILEFPLNFCFLDYLTELDISGNNLAILPDDFVNLKKLRVLNLSNNFFSAFPSVLYSGLHLIKFLNISNNKVISVNKPPCCLPKLQHLDLSCNSLCEPPPWLLDDAPTYLEYVNLSNNPCFEGYFERKETCSENNKVADSVKTLKISNCKFRDSICCYLLNFNSLSTLDIGNNEVKHCNLNYVSDLKCIPPYIEKLSMANVGLASVSSSLTDLPNLRHLNISGNMIHWLPASIKSLSSLTILRAETCNLCLIPCEMNELKSLKELYLSSNQLSTSEGFEHLVNLEVLDLYANQLISLPNFLQFSKLNSLDLCQNYVAPPSVIEINGLKYDYADLKTNLRSKIKNCDRIDGEKEFTTPPEDDLCDEFNESSPEEDFGDAESEDTYKPQNEKSLDQSQDCWDQDENETFDPNVWPLHEVLQITRKESYESLTGEIPYEVTTHPHYFTPYRLVIPITTVKNSLPPPVEGQFDD